MIQTSMSPKKERSKNQIQSFPTLKATSLAGSPVTLPDQAKGKVTLILIAFQRQAQAIIDSWLIPYLEEFMGKPGFTFYEIPMIEGLWWRLFSKSIDNGMRMGIPQTRHEHVVTFYGKTTLYVDKLRMFDRSRAYIFLLDPS